MSHTVKIPVMYRVSERPQLYRALAKLGWEVRSDNQFRSYAGNLPAQGDVAVNPDTSGQGYDVDIRTEGEFLGLYTDLWGGSVEKTLGHAMSLLSQRFVAEVVASEYPTAEITEELDNRGNLLLNVRTW